MRLKASITEYLRFTFLAICFVAISCNILSSYPNSFSSYYKIVKKEQKEDSNEKSEGFKFCAYEAVVPTAHIHFIDNFCFIMKQAVVVQTTVKTIKHSLPLFTRPYYRTLFQMIISPNAP